MMGGYMMVPVPTYPRGGRGRAFRLSPDLVDLVIMWDRASFSVLSSLHVEAVQDQTGTHPTERPASSLSSLPHFLPVSLVYV